MSDKSYKLSNQALGAVMMALQESLLNQLDIVPILKNFKLVESEDGLVVSNPPTVRFTDNSEVTNEDLEKDGNVMPRYRYVCELCESEKMVIHLSTENPEYFCEKCYEAPIMARALTTPQITRKVSTETNKIGQLTKEYIEDNKKILEEEKAKEIDYEPS